MVTRKKRSKNLTSPSIKKIVEILDGWGDEKLTWGSFISAIEQRLHVSYTRQALHRCERIRNALELKKEDKRSYRELAGKRIISVQLQASYDRVKRLEAENRRLENENNKLLEQFVVWAYNAHSRNMDEKFLNRPLPRVDRGQTR